MKVAQDEPTETLTSFNRRLVTKAKSVSLRVVAFTDIISQKPALSPLIS